MTDKPEPKGWEVKQMRCGADPGIATVGRVIVGNGEPNWSQLGNERTYTMSGMPQPATQAAEPDRMDAIDRIIKLMAMANMTSDHEIIIDELDYKSLSFAANVLRGQIEPPTSEEARVALSWFADAEKVFFERHVAISPHYLSRVPDEVVQTIIRALQQYRTEPCWIVLDDPEESDVGECSKCGFEIAIGYGWNYCPDCGCQLVIHDPKAGDRHD